MAALLGSTIRLIIVALAGCIDPFFSWLIRVAASTEAFPSPMKDCQRPEDFMDH
jgi:hypothetical protein